MRPLAAHRTLRVLHSTRRATGGTKYATHMAAVEGDGIEVRFFSWARALLGRYDLFHLHWPEALVGDGRAVTGRVRRVLARVLLARLRHGRAAVVYTRHNIVPHEETSGGALRRAFEELAQVEIQLVPERGRRARAELVAIPHGSYIEPFAAHARAEVVRSRVLFAGLMRRYKGIEDLLAAFAGLDDPRASLRLVGKPVDEGLAAAVERSAREDARVSCRFGFVPDGDLVAEVTAAELVVLPYRALHSSGMALVALSLRRPVLVPDTESMRALRDEVGAAWVRLFDGRLDSASLREALRAGVPGGEPDLSARGWDRVRAAHAEVYRRAFARKRAGRG